MGEPKFKEPKWIDAAFTDKSADPYNVQGHIKSADKTVRITNSGQSDVDLSINGAERDGLICGIKSFTLYNDPAEKVLFNLPAGCMVTGYIARLDIPFDGTDPTVQLGIRGKPDLISAPGDITLQGDPGIVSKATTLTLPQANPTDIIATLAAGGATTGNVRMIITYLIGVAEAEDETV